MPGQATVTIGDKQWECWVASTPAELAAGLGGVDSIPAGTGMLFILPGEQIVTVTAEHMLFPVDVIFISEDAHVTEVVFTFPPGGDGTTDLPCRYFLEVNAGEAEGIEPGDPVNIVLSGVLSSNWIEPMITITGVAMMGMMMTSMGKAMADTLSPQKERPVIYGPRGELLTQTTRRARSKSEYKIDIDRMGSVIITRTDDPGKDVYLQFESDKALVYDLLKKSERKELDAGWTVTIRRTEPRSSTLDELWEGARSQSLPQTGKRKPTRHDIEIGTWTERDRTGIWLTDKRTGKTIAEWWDEDAREMFEQGWFKPGDIRHQEIRGRAFEESVLDYAESVGILAGGKYLAQTVRDAYYWTAINKDTGEIVESTAPYTSSGRALRGGKAFVSRHWHGTAQVEIWKQPHRYSEKLKIEPVASEMLHPAATNTPTAVVPAEPRKQQRPGPGTLEFLPDSPEFLAYTIDEIGYRDKIDNAFLNAITRANKSG